MMVDVTRTVIYLGSIAGGLPDIDPDDVAEAENPSGFIGMTFGQNQMSLRTVTYSDPNNDGFVDFDDQNGAGDVVTHSVSGASVTETVNQAVWYDILITLEGGATLPTSALVFQTASGETFLTEFSASLDNLAIQSIQVTGIVNNMFARMFTSGDLQNTTVCMAAGTRVRTPGGAVAVERIAPGDLVCTLDGGEEPVLAVLQSLGAPVSKAAPIRFAPGSIGRGLPSRVLCLSPNHRVLCASASVRRIFGAPEVLIPAKRFVGLPGISQDPAGVPMRYFNLQLPRHAILFAEDAPVESCLMGPETIKALPAIPTLLLAGKQPDRPCRPIPVGRLQKVFRDRLIATGDAILHPELAVAGGCKGADLRLAAVE